MLSPEDVDELMENYGLQTDDIENLRLFYNQYIKNKELDEVLRDIEEALKADKNYIDQSEVITPQSSRSKHNFGTIGQPQIHATQKVPKGSARNNILHMSSRVKTSNSQSPSTPKFVKSVGK